MKLVYALFFLTIIGFSANAQETTKKQTEQLADFTLGSSSAQTTIGVAYYKNWNLGKKQHFFIGTGLRFSSAMGKNKTFTSAPASLASNDTSIDSLLGANTSIYALNAIINLGYHISSKLDLGFNIDLIGFSFGPSSNHLFRSNGLQTLTTAKPTGMNILLVGNNDRGTLNSEFYLRYKINNKLGIKLMVQHFFTELTTNNKVQTLPVQNDRFRNITDLFGFGLAYHF
ncbi:MAG: hypothetical protein Q8K64_16890 [Sediminibacterium sp.]|nr:hypothetical protein [Sediminibacterium sp.]TXT29393.1 MAG: hypothetical protein FD136_1858 [Chitinophagaceae bacterium]